MSKMYLKIYFIVVACLLCLVALFNYFIDPGSIYFKQKYNSFVIQKYTELLLESKFGMIQEGWPERDVKLSLLTRASDSDCILLGSSHVMSISLYQGNGISNLCESLVNLGVSGAVLEDFMIFSDRLLSEKKDFRGKKIIIGIDPWFYNFSRDSRHIPYLNTLKKELKNNLIEAKNYSQTFLLNLISFDYFFESLKLLKRDGLENNLKKILLLLSINSDYQSYVSLFKMKMFSFEKGAEKAVTLSDGSHVYSKKYITESHEMNGGNYKLVNGMLYDKKAIHVFEDILSNLKARGFKIYLLFTPYHQNVWNKKSGKLAQNAMQATYQISAVLAEKLNLSIIGSYHPDELKCKKDEFYDFMHPKPSCLNKIFIK